MLGLFANDAAPVEGGLPISVATSLAIEGFLGILPEEPNKDPAVHHCHHLLINIYTLIRNLRGAFEKNVANVDLDKYTLYLMRDMNMAAQTIRHKTNGKCKVTFYAPNYGNLEKNFPKANIRKPKTEGQKILKLLEADLINRVRSELLSPDYSELNVLLDLKDEKTPAYPENVAMLTHCSIDLLNRYSYNGLLLLESHTGKVKKPSQWSSKFAGSMDLVRIPFNKAMVQIFGDTVHIAPMPIKIKRAVIQMAIDGKWSPTTTRDKILASAKKGGDPVLEALIYELFY